ncbi:hypothetical protein Fmac_013259 [Flemingia macrophylla]|uniref:Phosphomannose isomerase type I C-terminal domain-containing protein n=1 Tax=Flemingia macrophylla TaxID=520843 RepID=A0ABD1MSM8_9FABA
MQNLRCTCKLIRGFFSYFISTYDSAPLGSPEILRGVPVNEYVNKYTPPFEEFEIDCCILPQGETVVFPEVPGPSIFLVTVGEGTMKTGSAKGHAVTEDGRKCDNKSTKSRVLFLKFVFLVSDDSPYKVYDFRDTFLEAILQIANVVKGEALEDVLEIKNGSCGGKEGEEAMEEFHVNDYFNKLTENTSVKLKLMARDLSLKFLVRAMRLEITTIG